jgi:hypothetical protein
MPTLSASDYTTFVKLKAASLAYQNNRVPNNIQTSMQPFATSSALYAQLLGDQASLTVSPLRTALSPTAYGRVAPYNGVGYVNNPKRLSTVSSTAAGNLPVVAGSVNFGTRAPPLGRFHVE